VYDISSSNPNTASPFLPPRKWPSIEAPTSYQYPTSLFLSYVISSALEEAKNCLALIAKVGLEIEFPGFGDVVRGLEISEG